MKVGEMQCLNCNSKKFETKKVRVEVEMKGEMVEAIAPAYVCTKCGEQLADAEQMNVLRMAVADSYRAKHGLLQSHEIVAFRKSLSMSQREFAKYLDVGEASIKRWETYFVQDESQDEHMRLKCDQLYAEENAFDVAMRLQKADEYNGKREFSYERFQAAVLFLVDDCTSPLFLNKALFYVDFLHYRRRGVSLTGSPYAKLDYGPCPDGFRVHFQKMIAEKKLKESAKHELIRAAKLNVSLFDDYEIETLEMIRDLVKKDGGQRLYDLSHKEPAYVETSFYGRVSYEFARHLLIKPKER